MIKVFRLTTARHALAIFLAIFIFGAHITFAAPIKILNNSRHAYSTITSTIVQLLGRSYTSDEFIVHSTALSFGSCATDSAYAGVTPSIALATSSGFVYCDQSAATTTAQFPYQIFSTSFTGNQGDSVAVYNQFASYDLTDDYAFTASPTIKMPPAFYTAPGGGGWASGAGVEWTIDPAVFCVSSLSCLTAANTGIMAWLRFNHSTWNWFDVKAAMRQNGTNWNSGYSSTTYGFGVINATTTNALTDGEILLQPPEVTVTNAGVNNQITFTVYPFRQTRRVKDVLFQFASSPGFQASELTLAQIQALGGTKITEYTGTTATSTAPIGAAVSNAYFIWFTADNNTDSSANFSRIDTYAILGPVSQNEAPFFSTFDISSPVNNAVSATASPTFTWNAASSYLGISKYQLFIDGSLDTDNILGISATPTSALSDGTHTWYVKAFNTGGAATTTVSTPTVNIVTGYTSGYTFYVDNVLGSDNNPGTQALPWATLAKAGATASAGDTVVIIKNANQPYRALLSPSNNGTSGNPITFRGADANTKPEIWGSNDISSGWSVYNGGNPNTYQKTVTTLPNLIAAGPSISNLAQKTWGSSANALNPGEWFWSSDTMYYRLANGEDISTLHVEASTRSYVISSLKSYVTYKNLVARYADSTGVNLAGTGAIAEGVEVYDSYVTGIQAGSNTTVRYSVSARNGTYGIASTYASNMKIYNSLMYGNGTSGGNFDILSTTNGGTIKNNISSGNTTRSFSFAYFWAAPTITASNNAWDIVGDGHWDAYKGTNNLELVNSLLINPSAGNFQLQQFSPNIDTGTSVGLTTDVLGNPIYGTPDIGPYEYQPPYSITARSIPIGGSFRVYKNGKYRMTTATSSSATANMNITPVDGFPSGDYSEWLNVTVNSWSTSGDYSKSWTESSPVASATTVHTVGDLAPNGFYTVSVDGIQYAQFRADGGGQGTFTYSGGYSTHTFSIAPDLSVGNGPIVGSSFSFPAPLPGESVSTGAPQLNLQSSIPSSTNISQTTSGANSITTSTPSIATTTPTIPSSVTSTPTLSSPAVIKEKIMELQTELVTLLKQLVALLRGQLQNVTKTI